jgi:chromosome segregation ATPase
MYYNTYNIISLNNTKRFKMALTIEQIHSTADRLNAEGVKPTLAKVRTALGGGSFTTISEAMQSWKREQQEEQELQQVELPSDITERLQSLGAQIWEAASSIANDRLITEREALATVKTEALADVEEAKEAVKTLEFEQNDLMEALEEATTENKKVSEQLNAITEEYNNFKEKQATDKAVEASKLTAAVNKLEREQERTSSAQERVKELQLQIEEIRLNQSNLIEQLATAKEQNKSLTTDAKRLTNERDDNIKKLSIAVAEQAKTQKELSVTAGKLEVLEPQFEALKDEKVSLAAQLQKMSEEKQTMAIESERLKSANEQQAKDLKGLQQKSNKVSS